MSAISLHQVTLEQHLPVLHSEQDRAGSAIGMAFLLRLGLPELSLSSSRLLSRFSPPLSMGFSWRDLILIAGGLSQVRKATKEIHHNVDPEPDDMFSTGGSMAIGITAAIGRIFLLDLVFSIDRFITAAGTTDEVAIMVIAVLVAVKVMLVAADPLAMFIEANPTVVMLALGFVLMIGMTLIAEGFAAHVLKGYIYAAMAFSALLEVLNMLSRRVKKKSDQARMPVKR